MATNFKRFEVLSQFWTITGGGTTEGVYAPDSAGQTVHFLDAPRTTTTDTTATLLLAAEGFDPTSARFIPSVSHVGRAETQSCTVGTALVYPGTGAQTNAVAPYEVTFDLDIGENVFQVTYIGADGITTIVKEQHIWRKASLTSVNVTTKSDLVAAIGTALRSANGSGNDVINVTSALAFDWAEFKTTNDALTAGDQVPNIATRDYPPVINGNNQLTFKMDFQTQLEATNRAAVDALGGFVNFPPDNFLNANMHFKNTIFGQDDIDNPMTAQITYSDAPNTSGALPCFTVEDCTIYGSVLRATDGPTSSPVTLDNGRNRYPNTLVNRFPKWDNWTGTTSIIETTADDFTSTITLASNVWSFNGGTSFRNASTGCGIDTIKANNLGGGNYEIILTFFDESDARILKSMAKWSAVHDYGVDLFVADDIGYTNTSQFAADDFTSELSGNPSANEIILQGPKADLIGAQIFNNTGTIIFGMMKRSAQFPSSLSRGYVSEVAEGYPGRAQRISIINTTYSGGLFQGGFGNAERMVGVNFQQNRGDIGHNVNIMFNITLESGDYILSSDFFDITHADIAQFFNTYDMGGRLYQNIYKGSNGVDSPDTTIAWIFDRTNIDKHAGIVMDNIIEDPAVYTWNGTEIVGSQTIGATFSGLQQHVRMSNLNLVGTTVIFRWDYGTGTTPNVRNNTTLNVDTYNTTFFHNTNFYKVTYLPMVETTGPDLDSFNVTAVHDSKPAGVDLSNWATYFSDPDIIGVRRAPIRFSGSNTLFDPS